MSTFGPTYRETLDGVRILTQMERVRNFMLIRRDWLTIEEISNKLECVYLYQLHFPEPSVSAQLRHLRKEQFGGYILEKREREHTEWHGQKIHGGRGLWEYKLSPPARVQAKQLELLKDAQQTQ